MRLEPGAHPNANAAREYYAKNKARIKAKNKIYRDSHRKERAVTDKLWRDANAEKIREKRRRYKQKNNEKTKAHALIYRARNKYLVSGRNLWQKYRLTLKDYEEKLLAQGGVCAICGMKDKRRLSVDHDHATGRVRGLLCHKCNVGLGWFTDSAEFLKRAARYIGDKHECAMT